MHAAIPLTLYRYSGGTHHAQEETGGGRPPPPLQRTKKGIKQPRAERRQQVVERTRDLALANEALRQELAERRQAKDDLREQHEMLQKIFDHLPVMINFMDKDGHIELVNRAWEGTLGWSLEEIQAHNLDIFVACYP